MVGSTVSAREGGLSAKVREVDAQLSSRWVSLSWSQRGQGHAPQGQGHQQILSFLPQIWSWMGRQQGELGRILTECILSQKCQKYFWTGKRTDSTRNGNENLRARVTEKDCSKRVCYGTFPLVTPLFILEHFPWPIGTFISVGQILRNDLRRLLTLKYTPFIQTLI